MHRLTLVVLVVALAACGDTPLEAIGEHSSAWLGSADRSPPASVVVEPTQDVELVRASDVRWWNDGLARSSGSSQLALETISARRNPGDRFAQASRREIAAFFPDLEFPSRIPADVRSVTSQLVLAASEAAFAPDHIASFGLWTADPYTQSRTVGQLATITVFVGARDDLCAVAGAGCQTERLGERTVGVVDRPSGETVVWSGTELTYEMFVRAPAASAVREMIESITPLAALVDTAAEPAEGAGASGGTATVP